jgi:hypothetical protein
MKNFIKRITDRIRSKPLLVKPVVSTSFCGWVDVNERLPEPSMAGGAFSFDVLTYSKAGSYYIMAYDYELKGWTNDKYKTITHWRDLPDSPERVG